MTVSVQNNGSVTCDHCGISLSENKDNIIPPGLFYHPQNAWFAEMKPHIVESSKTCPNAGRIFMVRGGKVI